MLPRRVFVVPILLSACVLTFGAGCAGQRPENSPYIKSKFAELDEQLKDFAKLKRDITLLQDDIKYFAEELGNVRTVGGGLAPDQADALVKLTARAGDFDKVQADLAAAHKRIEELEKSLGAVRAASSARPASTTPVRSVTPASNTAATPARIAATGSNAAGSGAAVSTPTQRTRAGGFYYQVKASDTLTSVARAHNIAIRDLARANNLPENAMLGVGQRLWVP